MERGITEANAGQLNCRILAEGANGPTTPAADRILEARQEEIFVILEGEGVLLVGDEETPVRPGHAISRPPATGVAHTLRADARGLTYLAYGTREPNDICWYPHSRKISWRGVGVIARVEPLDYWDGED